MITYIDLLLLTEIWTTEEDENLKQLVTTYGTGNCKSIHCFLINKLYITNCITCLYCIVGTLVAQSLSERTGKQCRERWHNHLGSGIKKGEWTEEVSLISIINCLSVF